EAEERVRAVAGVERDGHVDAQNHEADAPLVPWTHGELRELEAVVADSALGHGRGDGALRGGFDDPAAFRGDAHHPALRAAVSRLEALGEEPRGRGETDPRARPAFDARRSVEVDGKGRLGGSLREGIGRCEDEDAADSSAATPSGGPYPAHTDLPGLCVETRPSRIPATTPKCKGVMA